MNTKTKQQQQPKELFLIEKSINATSKFKIEITPLTTEERLKELTKELERNYTEKDKQEFETMFSRLLKEELIIVLESLISNANEENLIEVLIKHGYSFKKGIEY